MTPSGAGRTRKLWWGAMAVAGITLVLVLLTSGCSCVSYSAHGFIGPSPPPLVTAADVPGALRPNINRSIGGVARSLGSLTVGFKRIGILGWNDMGFAVEVEGQVRQAAYSTDRFLTLDLELHRLLVDGVEHALDGPRLDRKSVV